MITLKLVRNTSIIHSKCLFPRSIFKLYGTSQPTIQNAKEQYESQLKDFETLSNITKKVRKKKPQKKPFAKNLLLGEFDTDILTYPQLEKNEVQSLEKSIDSLKKTIKSDLTDHSCFEKKFRKCLSDHKAIGLKASQFLDGKECNMTESLSYLEALSEHDLRYSIVSNEQLGVQSLVEFGSDVLQKKYLTQAMQGELLTAFCLSETGAIDLNHFGTKAVLSQDGKNWVLNGGKTWVVNGSSADLFIVFAVTETVTRDVITDTKLTAFVVEKNYLGVSVKKRHSTGIDIADISFTDTPIPVENVIGQVNKAQDMLAFFINNFRLSTGSMCITVTKKILNNLTAEILDKSDETNMLHKTDALRGRIGELTATLYAMESISYLTAGLIDNYENQDCEVECGIVKIFSSENTMKASTVSFDLIGSPAVSDTHWANVLHKEAIRLATLYETNDCLKIIIALLGLQYAGVALNDSISKIRNPLFHGGFTLKRMWSDRRNIADDPKLDLYLGEYLHPSTYGSSQHLEYCIKRLQFASEMLLARHGPEIVNQHMDLRRLADVMIDVYAMTACLARASRSYCIGLQHGDYEMMIANTFCNYAMERVKENVKKIYEGQNRTNDENYRVISKRLFKFKEYFPKHPLSRNF